jgi:hypothetical protein
VPICQRTNTPARSSACHNHSHLVPLLLRIALEHFRFHGVPDFGVQLEIPRREAYLGDVFGRPRGLPQMQDPSDRLADTYLSILERRLNRDGFDLSRYVDDLRVIANDWEQANQIVEKAAEYARDLGLILSSEKTKIFKRETLRIQHAEEREFFVARFHDAKESLKQFIFMAMGTYGDQERAEGEADSLSAAQAACWDILNEWGELATQVSPEMALDGPAQRLISAALIILREYEERLPDQLLIDIVFHIPQRLEQVCGYLAARAEMFGAEDHWRTLGALMRMGRQSPWAKLWLMDTAERLASSQDAPPEPIRDWAGQQLLDRHELVGGFSHLAKFSAASDGHACRQDTHITSSSIPGRMHSSRPVPPHAKASAGGASPIETHGSPRNLVAHASYPQSWLVPSTSLDGPLYSSSGTVPFSWFALRPQGASLVVGGAAAPATAARQSPHKFIFGRLTRISPL